MTFAQIPHGERLFIDANPLVYFFNADPMYGAACQLLMTRIEHQEISAFTSTQELSDVAHRVMCYEAMQRFGRTPQGLAAKLKGHPTELKLLIQFRRAVDALLSSRIQMLTTPPSMVLAAADLSILHGFLVMML